MTAHAGSTNAVTINSPKPIALLLGAKVPLLVLLALYLTAIAFYGEHTLDNRYFAISKVGTAGEAIAIVAQAVSVLSLSVFTFATQRIGILGSLRRG